MKTVLIVFLAFACALFLTGCKSETVVDQEAAKMAASKPTGPTEKCANCSRDFPEGSLKDRGGKRLCGTCIDELGV